MLPFGLRRLYEKFTKKADDAPKEAEKRPVPGWNWNPGMKPPISLPSRAAYNASNSPQSATSPSSSMSDGSAMNETSGSSFSWTATANNRKRKIPGPTLLPEHEVDPNGNSVSMDNDDVHKRMVVDVADANCYQKQELVGSTFVDLTADGYRQVHVSGNLEDRRMAARGFVRPYDDIDEMDY